MDSILQKPVEYSIDLAVPFNSPHSMECFGHDPDAEMRASGPVMPGMADMKVAFVHDLELQGRKSPPQRSMDLVFN